MVRRWDRARSVLEVVNNHLGTADELRRPDASMVMVAVLEKRVVGCLVAEPIDAGVVIRKNCVRNGKR